MLRRSIPPAVGALGQDKGSYRRSRLTSTIMVSQHLPTFKQPLTSVLIADQSQFDASFDASYHAKPAPFTGSSRLSLAPRKVYSEHAQEPRVLSNANNHFRYALNLREGLPINPASARPDRMQASVQSGQQRNAFSLQPNNTQPRSGINDLANTLLIQKSMPPSQPDPEPNFFHAHQASRINQLQPQKQQVTPPFNLCMYVPGPPSSDVKADRFSESSIWPICSNFFVTSSCSRIESYRKNQPSSSFKSHAPSLYISKPQ